MTAVRIGAIVAMIAGPSDETAVKSKETTPAPVRTMLAVRMTGAARIGLANSATIVLSRPIRASAAQNDGNSVAPIVATAVRNGAPTGGSVAKIADPIVAKGEMIVALIAVKNVAQRGVSVVTIAGLSAGTVVTTDGRTVENGVKIVERTVGTAVTIAGSTEETVAITVTPIETDAGISGALITVAIERGIVRAGAISGARTVVSTVTTGCATEAMAHAASMDIIPAVIGGSFIIPVTILMDGCSQALAGICISAPISAIAMSFRKPSSGAAGVLRK